VSHSLPDASLLSEAVKSAGTDRKALLSGFEPDLPALARSLTQRDWFSSTFDSFGSM